MRQVRDGQVGGLEVLFDRHHRALLHYFLHVTGNRATSEDLVQEVFFRVLKYRRSYQTESKFRAWLFQIGRNAYLDHIGRNKQEVAWPAEAPDIKSLDAAPDRLMEEKQETALLRQALAALPPEKREVLVMSRFLELKYEEIAAALQCEVGTVKVRVYRALHELGDRFFALRGEPTS